MEISIRLEPVVAQFYTKIAQGYGKELEQVLEDALFCLAGELSLQAIGESKVPIS